MEKEKATETHEKKVLASYNAGDCLAVKLLYYRYTLANRTKIV